MLRFVSFRFCIERPKRPGKHSPGFSLGSPIKAFSLRAGLPNPHRNAAYQKQRHSVVRGDRSDRFVDDTNEVVVGPLGVKFAVTDSGALMVTVVEALLALAAPPVQLEKAKPVSAVAVRFTNVPAA